MAINKTPKIGLALSGASGRAMAHIAVLEVFHKHNIPIDILIGCSSGALIAASYAVGTLDELKKWFYQLTTPKLFKFWSVRNTRGGIFHLNTPEAQAQLNQMTHNLQFEDISHPKLGFVATDLNSGELITLQSGSLNEAFKASVAVPGLFEPVVIDGRVLVDGGLVNIVPTKPAKDLGADIVIGVNASGARFIYQKKMPLWRAFRFTKKYLGLDMFSKVFMSKLNPKALLGLDASREDVPGVMGVMSKAIEHSFRVEEEWDESHVACDLMIETGVKDYGKTEFNNLEEIYEEGRRAAEAAVPEIQKLILNFSKS